MRSAKDVHVVACAAAILVGDFHPGNVIVSLVTKNIRDYAAVRELAPIISSAPVDSAMRTKCLDRLFEAIQEDDPPDIASTPISRRR